MIKSEDTEEITQWGVNHLNSIGYEVRNTPHESIKQTPWSNLVRFKTQQGNIYLKQTPAKLAMEPDITKALHSQFRATVPEVIAVNQHLNAFMMKDSGGPLRHVLKENFDVALMQKAIEQFTAMQMSVADHLNIFLELGVPDWRLDKFTGLYTEILSQNYLLQTEGLTYLELNDLKHLIPRISDLCHKLSQYNIKQTIVQPDFHDNNILIDDHSKIMTFIDLGEIVISHPFFSLISCLRQLERHHGLTDSDSLEKIGLIPYSKDESETNLLDAYVIASELWLVYEVLCQYRLMNVCGRSKIMEYQPKKLGNTLKEFINLQR